MVEQVSRPYSTLDNIVLIGMPGVGKSTLGVVLAKVMRKDFLDCDLLIQARYGKTLEEIITDEGTQNFIAKESRVLQGIDVHNSIISTGGSAIYTEEAMKHLAEQGTIVYLKTSLEELEERLGPLEERGVVMRTPRAHDLKNLYDERAPLYERYAQITVDVEGLAIRQAVHEVLLGLDVI